VLKLLKLKLDTLRRFLKEIGRHYGENETSLAASSLAYTSLLALVPFMTVIVTVFSAMPLIQDVGQQIQEFIFENFVPTTGDELQQYVKGFAENSRSLSISMFLATFITSILMMHTMEKALNRIYDTKPSGNLLKKITMYWAVLTMGPLLVGGGIALTTSMLSNPGFNTAKLYLLKVMPVLASTFGFFLIYLVVPNRKVKWKSAFIGALTAAILFEFAKRGFAWYVTTFPSYQKIYGALATIPIFLVWVFLSWNIILLGGTIAAILETSRWRLHVQNYRENHRFLVIIDILYRLWQASKKGNAVCLNQISDALYCVPDNEIFEQLKWLEDNQLIQINQDGDYFLLRDMESISIGKLYTMGHFSLPASASNNFEFFEPFIKRIWSKIFPDMKLPVKTIFKQIEKDNEK
jgi:membrane protein